ncbi:MAG: hypothetical protein AAF968_01425 [Pseudomonadota bacterium]
MFKIAMYAMNGRESPELGLLALSLFAKTADAAIGIIAPTHPLDLSAQVIRTKRS